MDEITPLIESTPTKIIRSRFLVKLSVLNNGVNPVQYMVAVYDLLENHFTIKCYNDSVKVASLVSALHLI